MIEIRPYSYKDALILEPSEIGVKKHPDYEKWARLNELGPSYTIVIDNEVIACAGIRIFWKGSGEAWTILSSKSARYLKLILETFSKRLEIAIRELKLRWIQVSIDADFEKGIHFAQHFGFKRKCIQKGYLPGGRTAFLYAIENEVIL